MNLADKLKSKAKTPNMERRQQIAFLLRWGLSDKQIARLLGVVQGTVKIHMKNVLLMSGLHNRTQVAVEACRTWGFPNGEAPLDKGEFEFFWSRDAGPVSGVNLEYIGRRTLSISELCG